MLLATAALPVAAQVTQPVPTPGAAAPSTAAPQAAPAMSEAERKASEERIAAQEKQAEAERKATEERMKEQEKQAEKERKAAEKQAEADRKAAEKAAADAAAAEKLAAERAAAAAATAPVAVAAAPVAAPLPKDSRDRVVQICTTEAQRRGKALGATDVSLEDVKDTDVKSDGRASMQAKMNLYTKDSKGKVKKQSKKVTCATKNDVVTSFKVN